MKIKAVIFDIDGTIYSNNMMYLATLPLFFTHVRTMLSFSKVRKILHSGTEAVDRSGMRFQDYQIQLLAQFLQTEEHKARKKLDTFRENWEKIFQIVRPYPYFRSFVAELRANQYKIALLTDFPIGNKMRYLKLDGLWDYVLCTEDAGALKPDSRGFRQVATALGLKTEECLYVGNSYRLDIKGANAVGMQTAHLKWGRAEKDSEANYTFYSYKKLRRQLETCLNFSKKA